MQILVRACGHRDRSINQSDEWRIHLYFYTGYPPPILQHLVIYYKIGEVTERYLNFDNMTCMYEKAQQ